MALLLNGRFRNDNHPYALAQSSAIYYWLPAVYWWSRCWALWERQLRPLMPTLTLRGSWRH
jgi:hypothetical protein